MTILHPDYFRVLECQGSRWVSRGSKLTGTGPAPLSEVEERYNITRSRLITDLFRINGGRLGYYLANLRDKRYYYCGESLEDVRLQLLALGIGRADPMEDKC